MMIIVTEEEEKKKSNPGARSSIWREWYQNGKARSCIQKLGRYST
jgi:hypothetical protein